MIMGSRHPRRTVLAGVMAGLLVTSGAGCASASHGGSGAAGPSARPRAGDRARRDGAAGAVPKSAACLPGTWKSTGMRVTAPGGLREHGAARVRMRISGNGSVVIRFGGMAPVHFTSHSAGGSFVFAGDITGKAVMPAPGAATGTWRAVPGSGFDYRTLTVTVHVTRPLGATMGPFSIRKLASQFGGGASVASAPLGGGTWTCGGNTLVNHPPSGAPSGGTWTWTRAS